MRYIDLLESKSSLHATITDILTPLASNGVEYINVDSLISKIDTAACGMKIDREFIMTLIDPDKFSIVDRIEGDKVYLQGSEAPIRAVGDDQKNKEQDRIKDTAAKQAIKKTTS